MPVIRRTGVAILGGLVLSAALFAQETASESTEKEVLSKRPSVGGRISVMGRDLLESGTTTLSYTALEYTYTSESKSARVGAGPSLEYAATRKLSFAVDFVYHRFGYKTTTEILTGVDNTSTSTDERKKTSVLEKTRASFWDLPVVARYSVRDRNGGRMKVFAAAGFAFRHLSGIHTATETTYPDASTCCTETPATPSHRSARGLVVGAGLRMIDDFGIKMTPEVRYTHWLADAFSPVPAQSRRNQLEILIGITF
jgi:hypothetical protein